MSLGARKERASFSREGLRQSPARRRLLLETLEGRAMLAPLGALPDDTAEYALGDVLVSVVLLESDQTLAPHDDGSITVLGQPVNYTPENWTAAAISNAIQKVRDGANWWSETLDALPNVADGLLKFQFDLTYANTPVRTGYEAIARTSNDLALWIYDFLGPAGFGVSGDFSKDVRAFNNFQREKFNTDWAFTVFVVNDANDAAANGGEGMFAAGGTFRRAFAFPGGQFTVMPASRPTSSFAHEIGHIFWAFDEYSGGTLNTVRRGYYNAPNANGLNGAAPGFVQQPSIMSSGTTPGTSMQDSYDQRVLAAATQAIIGWQDSDGDGVFDVLDVPFSLTGVGSYDSASGKYRFSGQSAVRTLPNLNTSGLGNDISINKIRAVQYSINDGPWTTAPAVYNAYQQTIALEFAAPAGNNTIKIRTLDTRTTVTSDVFVGNTRQPSQSSPSGGVSGFAYRDDNGNGVWDSGELPVVDAGVAVVDAGGNPLSFRQRIEPNDYAAGAVLTAVDPGVTLLGFGNDVNGPVVAFASVAAPSAGQVFGASSLTLGLPSERWTQVSRNLRIVFNNPVAALSLRALAGSTTAFARLELYDANNNLLERLTTSALSSSRSELFTVSRPQADIAYAVAKGHAGTEVLFDSLTWGPPAATTTNALGAYQLPSLPPGTYTLQVTAPPNHIPTSPATGKQQVVLVSGGASDVNFAFAFSGNSWHNLPRPLDVNGDTFVTGLDVVLVVNWLNATASPNTPLPAIRPPGEFFLDVSNDNYVTGLDAVLIVNYLNSLGNGSGEAPPAAPPAPGGLLGGETPASEGEEPAAPAAAQTAAEYFARNPLHLSNIAGVTDDAGHSHGACGCCDCAIATIAAEQVRTHSTPQPTATARAAGPVATPVLVSATSGSAAAGSDSRLPPSLAPLKRGSAATRRTSAATAGPAPPRSETPATPKPAPPGAGQSSDLAADLLTRRRRTLR